MDESGCGTCRRAGSRGPEDVPVALPDCVRPSVFFTANGKVVAFVDGAGMGTLAAKETLKP